MILYAERTHILACFIADDQGLEGSHPDSGILEQFEDVRDTVGDAAAGGDAGGFNDKSLKLLKQYIDQISPCTASAAAPASERQYRHAVLRPIAAFCRQKLQEEEWPGSFKRRGTVATLEYDDEGDGASNPLGSNVHLI